MAQKFNLRTHQLRKGAGGRVLNVATDPYARLSNGDSVIYLQHGLFWSEGGQEIEEPPGWALEMADALTDEVKKEVDWDQPDSGDAQNLSKAPAANTLEDIEKNKRAGLSNDGTRREPEGPSTKDAKAIEQGTVNKKPLVGDPAIDADED